jgi:hypothetical protein
MIWAGHIARIGEKWDAYRIFIGKTALGRPKGKWVDNIKMDLREIVWSGMDWINQAQDRD